MRKKAATFAPVADESTSVQLKESTQSQTSVLSLRSTSNFPLENIDLGPDRLSSLNTLIAIGMLCDTVEQLTLIVNILKRRVGDVPASKLVYKTLEQRFDFRANPCNLLIGDEDINKTFTESHKLQNDVKTLIYLLEDLIAELHLDGTFKSLVDTVFCIVRLNHDETSLFAENHELSTLLTTLRSSFKAEKIDSKQQCEQMANRIVQLSDATEKLIYFSKEKLKYTEKWENARQDQNNLKLSQKEKHLENTIKTLSGDMVNEVNIHTEITSYLEESREDRLASIQDWMQKYDDQVEEMDNSVVNLKTQQEQLTEDLDEIKCRYQHRIQEMQDWRDYCTRKIELLVQEARERWAARKIQRWWRSIMIKKKLYKRKKGKGKGKGKDKGKGKKTSKATKK